MRGHGITRQGRRLVAGGAALGLALLAGSTLAMPALWFENEPLVVKAARYIGLPVIASDIGTLAMSIRHGVNGWLLPAGDVKAWGDAISSIAPVPLPMDLSIKSMDDNARELMEIYQEIHSSQ